MWVWLAELVSHQEVSIMECQGANVLKSTSYVPAMFFKGAGVTTYLDTVSYMMCLFLCPDKITYFG